MNIYTMADWERDGSLSCKRGQAVTDDVIMELANCIPPTTWRSYLFQVGEAASHDPNSFAPLYDTFARYKNGCWVYLGRKRRAR